MLVGGLVGMCRKMKLLPENCHFWRFFVIFHQMWAHQGQDSVQSAVFPKLVPSDGHLHVSQNLFITVVIGKSGVLRGVFHKKIFCNFWLQIGLKPEVVSIWS